MEIGLNEKTVAIGSIGLGLFSIASSLFITGLGWLTLPVTLIVIVLTGISALVFTIGYAVLPMVTKFLKVTEIRAGGYEIPPTQDLIIKNVGGIYYASVFLYARIFEAPVTAGAAEVARITEEESPYMDLWERAISNIKFPFKTCMLLYVEDLTKYREEIQTKRATAQLRLGREKERPNPDPLVIDRWEREITRQDELLAKLASGEKPMGLVTYLVTTALGVTKEAAAAQVKTQANELRSVVSNALNLEMVVLTGEDMKKCFDWEFAIPPTPKDLKTTL
jgi:hypothetical protein